VAVVWILGNNGEGDKARGRKKLACRSPPMHGRTVGVLGSQWESLKVHEVRDKWEVVYGIY